MHMLISVCRRCSWNLLTGKQFCWVRSWAAGCPSSPHHRTQLWLGRAACSAPWTSPPSSDSCQRSDPDSFCCSGSIPTARLLRTANSVLSWLTDIIAFYFCLLFSSYILPASVTSRDHFTLPSVTFKSSLWSSCSPDLIPCWSPAAVCAAVNLQRYFGD